MVRRRDIAVGLVLGSCALAACGGGSSPAQPAPVPTATPTPLPTPTPKPLSVIPACPLPSNVGASVSCPASNTQLRDDVDRAIDRAIHERPDLFDVNDVNGGPRIKNYDGYMTAVVAALGEAGLCGRVDAEGEIGVKLTNGWSEQWSIWTSSDYVRRKYLYGCKPAVF